MGKDENRQIFEDTKRLCETNRKLAEAVRLGREQQRLIPESEVLPEIARERYPEPAQVTVSKKRTYEAASAYASEQRVAVLNFASASNPGGGVVNGAGAQEECLCRCSTLYFDLIAKEMWEGFYAPHRAAHDSLHNDDIIYTPGVTVFKSDTAYPKLLPEKDWYRVDVITCAAPNLRENPSNRYNPGDGAAVRISASELQALHEKRLRRILDVAVMQEAEAVILGAFGCGAFRNDPKVVAEAAKNVIPEYLHAFRTIEFAVYCREPDWSNYDAFRTRL